MSFCTDPYWLDLAKSLSDHGVTIKYLISRPLAVQRRARALLPNTIVISQETVEYPYLFEASNQQQSVVISQKLIDELLPTENEFLSITDRVALFPLTVKRRKQIFRELVWWWERFFSQERLDAIFLTDTPHVGFDTVMYSLAERRGIPVISMRRPFIRDRMLIVDDYRSLLPKVPRSFLSTLSKQQLQKIIGPELLADVFDQNPWQKKDQHFHLDAAFQNLLGGPNIGRWVRLFNPFLLGRYLLSLFTISKYGGFNYNNGQIKLVEKLYGLYHRLTLRGLRRQYDRLTKKVRFSSKKKYLYFPLHLQPERSTTPEGGIFEDQLLALTILSQALPTGWKILVKEHPRQFGVFDFQKHTYRNKNYYTKLANLPGVILVPMAVDQESLIKHAQLTATVTGTGGWEALKLHRPCLVFGNSWYNGCQSCFYVQSLADCHQAITAARKKNPKEVELDLLRFLAYYRRRFIIGSNAKEFARESERSYSFLVTNLAQAVKKAILKRL